MRAKLTSSLKAKPKTRSSSTRVSQRHLHTSNKHSLEKEAYERRAGIKPSSQSHSSDASKPLRTSAKSSVSHARSEANKSKEDSRQKFFDHKISDNTLEQVTHERAFEDPFSDSGFDTRDESQNPYRDVVYYDDINQCINSILKDTFPKKAIPIVEALCKKELEEIRKEWENPKNFFGEPTTRIFIDNGTIEEYQQKLMDASDEAISNMDPVKYEDLILDQIPENGRQLLKHCCKDELNSIFRAKENCLLFGEDFNEREVLGIKKRVLGVEQVLLIAKKLETDIHNKKDIPLSEAKQFIPSLQKKFQETIKDFPCSLSFHQHPCLDAMLTFFRKVAPDCTSFVDKSLDFGTGTFLSTRMKQAGKFADKIYELLVLPSQSREKENKERNDENEERETEEKEMFFKTGALYDNLVSDKNEYLAILLTLLFVTLLLTIIMEETKKHLKSGQKLTDEAIKYLNEYLDSQSKSLDELQKSVSDVMKQLQDLEGKIASNNYEKQIQQKSMDYVSWNNSYRQWLYMKLTNYDQDAYCRDHLKLNSEKPEQKQEIQNVKVNIDHALKFKDPVAHLKEKIDKINAKQVQLSKEMVGKIGELHMATEKVKSVKEEVKQNLEEFEHRVKYSS